MHPVAHQKATEPPKVPQVHIYNTRVRHIQGQDLTENHVSTIKNQTC